MADQESRRPGRGPHGAALDGQSPVRDVEGHLALVHRLIAQVAGDICFVIIHRRLSKNRAKNWIAQLEIAITELKRFDE